MFHSHDAGLQVGIDLVQVSRVAESLERFGPAFLRRIFTDDEIAYATAAPELTVERLAARFAAKEAARQGARARARRHRLAADRGSRARRQARAISSCTTRAARAAGAERDGGQPESRRRFRNRDRGHPTFKQE